MEELAELRAKLAEAESARLRLEEEVRKVRHELRESEARWIHVADNAPVMIWMSGTFIKNRGRSYGIGLTPARFCGILADLTKECIYFNKTWLDFTGRTFEQEYGYGWVEGVRPEQRSYCCDTYISAFEAQRPFSMEYEIMRHDGQYRWILDNGVRHFRPPSALYKLTLLLRHHVTLS